MNRIAKMIRKLSPVEGTGAYEKIPITLTMMSTAPFASLLLVADPVAPTDPVAPSFVAEEAAEEVPYLF